MELPGISRAAWDAIEGILGHPEICSKLDQQCFPLRASCGVPSLQLRFMPYWIELRRMEDSTLPTEAHIARARTHLRRALTRFRNSTYQPGDEEEG